MVRRTFLAYASGAALSVMGALHKGIGNPWEMRLSAASSTSGVAASKNAALGEAATGIAPSSPPESPWRWSFDKWADQQGWTVNPEAVGAVLGGGLWLMTGTGTAVPRQIEELGYEVSGLVQTPSGVPKPRPTPDLISPSGLGIPARQVKKIRMRLINLSPATDGFAFWRSTEHPGLDVGMVRFTMRPSLNQWQEVVAHMDDKWTGTIDSIRLNMATSQVRGDIWVGWIAITDGALWVAPPRPDVHSDKVVPRIALPGISQADFKGAFDALDTCLITHVPVFGVTRPIMSPGGYWGENWWQLDSSLAMIGTKWVNQDFAENAFLGLKGAQDQNPDGRIDLYGASAMRGQIGDVSSVPRTLEVAYDVARRNGDKDNLENIYLLMKRYADWFLSPVKRNAATGLITAAGEETFSATEGAPQSTAPMDLNVAVALGCHNLSDLAARLGKTQDAARYRQAFEQIKQGINQYMWNEADGVYYNYNAAEKKQDKRLICTTFDPLRLGIAPPAMVQKLIPKLTDPALFNWGTRPVTTIAKTEPDYVEETGNYNGKQWNGDIWTMRNLPIVAGLADVGRHDLAAELAWETIKEFNNNYREFVIPSTGKGFGAENYAWSASLYIQAVIEYLYGVDYDRMKRRLRVLPRVPLELMGKDLSLSQLIIPGQEARLSLRVKQTAPGQGVIDVAFSGAVPEGEMEILLPGNETKSTKVTDGGGRRLPVVKNPEGLTNVIGVRIPMRSSVSVRFD